MQDFTVEILPRRGWRFLREPYGLTLSIRAARITFADGKSYTRPEVPRIYNGEHMDAAFHGQQHRSLEPIRSNGQICIEYHSALPLSFSCVHGYDVGAHSRPTCIYVGRSVVERNERNTARLRMTNQRLEDPTLSVLQGWNVYLHRLRLVYRSIRHPVAFAV